MTRIWLASLAVVSLLNLAHRATDAQEFKQGEKLLVGKRKIESGACAHIKKLENGCLHYSRRPSNYYYPLPHPIFSHCSDLECLEAKLEFFQASCPYHDMDFLCALVFPRCEKRKVMLPCKEYCQEVLSQCHSVDMFLPTCDQLPEENSKVEKCLKKQCVDDTPEICAEMGFSKCHDPLYGLRRNFKSPESVLASILPLCPHPISQFYMCGYHLPRIGDEGNVLYPCREYCEEAISKCPRLRKEISEARCDELHSRLGNTFCMDPPTPWTSYFKRPNKTDFKVVLFLPRTKSLIFSAQRQCQPLDHKECSVFGYNMTSFPNQWARDHRDAARKFRSTRRALAFKCSRNVLLFVCTQLFPSCKQSEYPSTQFTTVCRSVCEDINKECLEYLPEQDCSSFPTTDCLENWSGKESCESWETRCPINKNCIPKSSVCDMNNDCGDWSDERHWICACKPKTQFRCKSDVCIPIEKSCDGVFDCPDESDEGSHCECKKNEIKCQKDNVCVMRQWICDGKKDCPSGEDEKKCSKCHDKTEWTCVNKACIKINQRCNGEFDCRDHSDEMDCIKQERKFKTIDVKVNGNEWATLCSEGFTNFYGTEACKKLGHNDTKSLKSIQDPFKKPKFHLHLGHDPSVVSPGQTTPTCPNGKVVSLECTPNVCGHSKEPVPRTEVEMSAFGQWPWLVQIVAETDKELICGGAIFNENFVITSAYCAERMQAKGKTQVVAGTNFYNITSVRRNQRTHSVETTLVHPTYMKKHTGEHDIALIMLKNGLVYNEDVRPLCLPLRTDRFTKANACFLAGWGQAACDVRKNRLRQRKLTLWDNTVCSQHLGTNLKHHQGCAEFYNGYDEVSQADSGSPVFCSDETDTFKFLGIVSPVRTHCTKTTAITFTTVHPNINWITNTAVCAFICHNRHCLVHKASLCDNVDDCGDSSDEGTLCGAIGVNSTFDKAFFSGYTITGDWRHLSGDEGDLNETYPLFDHTVGSYPGHWVSLYANATMISPLMNVSEVHCLRFHFIAWGKYDGLTTKIAAVYYFNGKEKLKVYELSQGWVPDRWRMYSFEVNPGPVQISFQVWEGMVSIDDVWLLEGKCQSRGCFQDEYHCVRQNTSLCYPRSSWCNLIHDCHFIDELCKDRKFTCDFENGNTCGMIRYNFKKKRSPWRLAKSGKTKSNITDHTYKNESGNMLAVDTSKWVEDIRYLMWHKLYLNYTTHCLVFFYASVTNGTFTVNILHENNTSELLKVKFKPTKWRMANVVIPPGLDATVLRYDLTVSLDSKRGEFFLDDLTVKQGACTCPNGTIQCINEDKCVEVSKICDRHADCKAKNDEKNCACRPLELRCRTGKCIPLHKQCDGKRDCPDGLDETVACDKKRSVTCKFESIFKCGYEVSPREGPGLVTWTRNNYIFTASNKMIIEHFEEKGFLRDFHMSVAYDNGGPSSRLISPRFNSTGNSLRFRYYAFKEKENSLDGALLKVAYRTERRDLWISLWFTHAIPIDTWQKKCIQLPTASKIKLSFVAVVTGIGNARFGLDDVEVVSKDCL